MIAPAFISRVTRCANSQMCLNMFDSGLVFSSLKKLLKLILSCNKSITLIAVTPPLFKCFYAEGNNDRENEVTRKSGALLENLERYQ